MKENLVKKSRMMKESGITLIALVVSIVVILLLAGVTIATLTGDNGILSQAQNANTTTKIAEIEEQANLIYTAELIERLSGQTSTELDLAVVCTELQDTTKYNYDIQLIKTDSPTITGILINPTTISIAQGDNTKSIEATPVVTEATGSWYAFVDGKYYRIYIPEGKKQVKIDRTSTDVDGEGVTEQVTFTSNNNKVVFNVTGTTTATVDCNAEGKATVFIAVGEDATGPATITAEAGGKTAECEVTVLKNVTVSTQVVNMSDSENVGTATEITNAPYAEGSEISLTAAVKNNYSDDYEFVGWYETKDSGTEETQKSTNASYTYTVPNDGTEEVVLKAKFREKPNPIAGKMTPTNNRTLSGSTDTSKMTYKNPVIPQGFIALDTTGATWSYTDETALDEVSGWNNGLVIKDSTNNNEFVWVPCTTESVTSSSPIVQYARNTNYPMYSGISNIANAGDTKSNTGDGKTYSAIPVTQENAQIVTYGGFYVARYEAGLSSASSNSSNNNYNNVPVSIAGTKVWNNVDYEHSYVAAQKMVNGTTYGNNKSGLITGIQWDTIMKWFEKSNIGVTGTTQDWGTYKDVAYSGNGSYFKYESSALAWISGSFSHSKYSSSQSINSSYPAHYHASGLNTTKGYKKNIADLGGNMSEWTSERCTYTESSNYRMCRGGYAYTSVTSSPASHRASCQTTGPTVTSFLVGFRAVLYVQ